MKNLPKQNDIRKLLVALKADIRDDYRASDDPSDTLPGMMVTIGWTPETGGWNYQTGDNSFTGGAYGHLVWAVVYLYRSSNCAELADEAIEELAENAAYLLE